MEILIQVSIILGIIAAVLGVIYINIAVVAVLFFLIILMSEVGPRSFWKELTDLPLVAVSVAFLAWLLFAIVFFQETGRAKQRSDERQLARKDTQHGYVQSGIA